MCLSTVYDNAGRDKLAENVTSVSAAGDKLTFIDLLGNVTECAGKILEIDLVKNLILVDHETEAV